MSSPMPRLQQKSRRQSPRVKLDQPAVPAQWFYGLYAPSTVSGLDSHRRLQIARKLDPSVGRSGRRDFAVRVCHVRPTQHPRPSHPRPTCRDDRPKRPSSSRRAAREHRGDLPDAASANACGRSRRAICAWRACGNCPSGASTQCSSKPDISAFAANVGNAAATAPPSQAAFLTGPGHFRSALLRSMEQMLI